MPTILDPLKASATPDEEEAHADGDIFASKEEGHATEQEPAVPDSFEELPIEIRSLTERYDAESTCAPGST